MVNYDMPQFDLQKRTRIFHINVIHICTLLPKNAAGFEIAKQLIRSAGSVGANCRSISRSKSDADFIHKVAIVIEEADESLYWLEIINETKLINSNLELLQDLIKEANELTAIFVSIHKNRNNKLKNS